MNDTPKAISLRQWRIEHTEYTQEELAALLQTTQSCIWRWESASARGHCAPPPRVVEKLRALSGGRVRLASWDDEALQACPYQTDQRKVATS